MGEGRSATGCWAQEYDASPGSVAEARRLARTALQETGTELPELDLVLSELAANAVRHANTQYRVEIEVGPEVVTVGVRDSSPKLPHKREPEPGAGGGRGLLIVEALARRWGVRRYEGDGKTVWAEVPYPA